VSSACASVEKIKFNFKLEKTVAAFKIATWRRKESFREEVEEFIDEFNRAQISKSADYFNDVFKSKKSDRGELAEITVWRIAPGRSGRPGVIARDRAAYDLQVQQRALAARRRHGNAQ
jgi:hypothetical protein